MKNKWIIYLTAIMVFLLCTATRCDDKSDYEAEPSDIANFDVVVLDNSGITPKPADGKPVARKALMLQFDFEQKVEGGEARESIGNKMRSYSKLNDVVDSIRIVSKTRFSEDVGAYSDITVFFKEKWLGKERFDTYSSTIFPCNGLKIALLAEPRVGQHKFEATMYFASKRELKKIVTLELQ